MMVADTDEEDSSTLPNVLYTTAIDGSDPDALLDSSEPQHDKSESASCGPARTIGIGKHASTQPNLSDCSLDISSGSDLVLKPTVAFGAAMAGNRFPLDASEPQQDKSESASCGSAGTIGIGKHASTQPNLSDCSLDISSGSDLVLKPTVAFGVAKAGNRFEHLSVLLSDLFEFVHFKFRFSLDVSLNSDLAATWESGS